MKLYEIKAVTNYLKKFDFIKVARRVANNTIELNFGKDESIFFDLTRGNSTIYRAPSQKRVATFNAPFDMQLHTLLAYSKILDISTPNDDKVIIFTIKPKSKYKEQIIKLRLEFTGKFTNAIITDNCDIVIDALHHIDSSKSYREVKPGVKLKELLPFKSKYSGEVEDVEALLEQNYIAINQKLLKRTKEQKLNIINKKINKLSKALASLPNQDKLLEESAKYSEMANIVLANLHLIKPYDKVLNTYDFNGNKISIKLPKDVVKNRISEYFFNLAKRLKNKANNIEIELSNLKGKLNFYQNIKSALEISNNLYEIELLVPKQAKSKQKKEKLKVGELFWIEGYKIYVGTNSKENQELLKIAKANDIWMHVRDIPGSHVIIRTDKQNLPDSLLQSAAKLCVDFSTKNPGNYEVDYTKRKFVKTIEGSNVEYDKYKTISVLKEGIEIRV
jgi:predicted ribosome quality control (RQC) complex YloA/Tae2 family protein